MPSSKIWKPVSHMDDIIKDLPGGAVQGDDCSIPDVYGKAIQFRLALERAHKEKRHMDEVYTWRGLITILALQNYYDFPVSWKKVTIPNDGNAFSRSLQFLPENFSIFTEAEQNWNGTDFYVLVWKNKDGIEQDLLLYSPATLVYPVADWRKVFSELTEITWFDQSGKFKSPEEVLQEPDKKVVSYWLEQMTNEIRNQINSNGYVILEHLDDYSADLGVNLSGKDRLSLSLTPIENCPKAVSILGGLKSSVAVNLKFNKDIISAKELFSDQLCCFYDPEHTVFQMCSHQKNYEIQGDGNLCAFLPLHPQVREYCGPFGLAKGISMRMIKQKEGDYIRVEAHLPNNVGMDLVKDYRISAQPGAGKGEAFYYKDDHALELPLIAVWPNKICDIYNQYYIMVEDDYEFGNFEIADTSGLIYRSKYVARTKYIPDAVPLAVRLLENGNTASIGMITLPVQTVSRDANVQISAQVAVDFGTSSTRVFAKISDREGKHEIFISDDGPLIVTSSGNERNIMRSYFVAPHQTSASQTKEEDCCAQKVFSIYNRSTKALKLNARPILDGVIYQDEADERLDGKNGAGWLMTDLKWGAQANKDYYEAFLKQLCLHVMNILYRKYCVTKITWKYALPAIMEEATKSTIHRVWQTEIVDYLKGIARSITCDVDNYVTESDATSRYFLYDKFGSANAQKGYLVIDIGGGSTDLALWQGTSSKREMKWHDSVNVAGRSMFTRWVAGCLNQFYLPDEQVVFRNMVQDVQAIEGENSINGAHNALVDRILEFYGCFLQTNYEIACNSEEPAGWAMDLRRKIVHSVSLMFFALGCQVGLLVDSGDLAVTEQPGTFVISVGGKGSQILDWTNYAIESESVAKTFFELGRKSVMKGKFSHVAVQTGPDPKSEVSRGLLEEARTAVFKPKKAGQEQDYASLFLKYIAAYKTVFKDKYPLRNITADDIRDALNRYTGDGRASLVRVFMEVFYMELVA